MLQRRINLGLGLIIGLSLLACAGPPAPQATGSPAPTRAPTDTPVPTPTPTSTSVPPTPTPPQPVTARLTPIKDGTLYQDDAGALSNGAGQHLFVGVTAAGSIRRTVIAFDIGESIPAGSTIISAALTLKVSRTHSAEQEITLHSLLADWEEGNVDARGNEGSGAPSAAGDVTWIHRSFGREEWAEPGGEFSPTPGASSPVADLGKYTWGPTPEMAADVQSWLADPPGNYGWLLKGNEEESVTTKRFDSRENEDLGVRPLLTVEYLPPHGP